MAEVIPTAVIMSASMSTVPLNWLALGGGAIGAILAYNEMQKGNTTGALIAGIFSLLCFAGYAWVRAQPQAVQRVIAGPAIAIPIR